MSDQRERTPLLQLIQQRPRNAKVFCVGVDNDVDRPLLEQLAQDSGGLASFLSRGDDFIRQAAAFRRKLMNPAASDLAVSITGLEVHAVEPAQLPNLYHGTPVRILGRYRGEGQARLKAGGSAVNLQSAPRIRLSPSEPRWRWLRSGRSVVRRLHRLAGAPPARGLSESLNAFADAR
jgi:hypothetical protein